MPASFCFHSHLCLATIIWLPTFSLPCYQQVYFSVFFELLPSLVFLQTVLLCLPHLSSSTQFALTTSLVFHPHFLSLRPSFFVIKTICLAWNIYLLQWDFACVDDLSNFILFALFSYDSFFHLLFDNDYIGSMLLAQSEKKIPLILTWPCS